MTRDKRTAVKLGGLVIHSDLQSLHKLLGTPAVNISIAVIKQQI